MSIKISAVAAAITGMFSLAVPMQWSTGSATFTPGAPSAGDPYFPDQGNGGYLATHYDLNITYDPSTMGITAAADIEGKATQNLSRFDVDFARSLTVDRVLVDRRPAKFSRSGEHKLVITPPMGLRQGRRFTVSISYSGVPRSIKAPGLTDVGWIVTPDKNVVTMSQPIGSAAWYPVNDTPADKATYDFHITVPAGLQALANGVADGMSRRGDKATYHWRQDQPMASELTLLAIGRYHVLSDRTTGGVPNITAISPQAVSLCTRQARQRGATDGTETAFHQEVADVLAWEVKIFGRYPFAATGGVADLTNPPYAVESQTRPLYTAPGLCPVPSTTLVVHETAHQWFGDSATPARWQDIWLNEGFATYVEWLYSEQHGGATAQQLFHKFYSDPKTDWSGKVAGPGRDHMFDALVYWRGAMALHVLRKTIGDRAFFRLIRLWPTLHQGGNVTTPELVTLAEQVSHKDLHRLFNAWLYAPGKPNTSWP